MGDDGEEVGLQAESQYEQDETARTRVLKAVHPVLMVREMESSLAFFSQIGFLRLFGATEDNPYYAGVRRDDVELHLQRHDDEPWRYHIDRPTYRIIVSDVDALHSEFRRCDPVLDLTDVIDTAWGTREFHLRDPDGNGLQFYQDF